ncbi:MAG: hypothetical protein KA369_08325 [Spirochaetes bacterium]|nr:hypothetical protein [Spirochaetota bacterium]
MESIITLITNYSGSMQSLFLAQTATNITLFFGVAGAIYKVLKDKIDDSKTALKEQYSDMAVQFSKDVLTLTNIICDVNDESKEQTGNIIRNMKDIEAIQAECKRRLDDKTK